jgi:hypothetical protein
MTTRTLNSAYSLYLMATPGGGGYRPAIDETIEAAAVDGETSAQSALRTMKSRKQIRQDKI